jgi:hypothetical protein
MQKEKHMPERQLTFAEICQSNSRLRKKVVKLQKELAALKTPNKTHPPARQHPPVLEGGTWIDKNGKVQF